MVFPRVLKDVVLISSIAMVLALAMLVPLGVTHAQSLGSYNVQINQTSASGVSSGAYMAGQLHVAYSANMVGVAIIAGGPYYCSQSDWNTAVNECWQRGTPTVNSLEVIEREHRNGKIDDPSNLQDDKVYLFTGSNDKKVATQVVDAANRQYQALVPQANIQYLRDQIPAGHSMVTDDYGNACSTEGGEYINDCDYDMAGKILEHIYGPLKPRSETLSGQIVEFEQSQFVDVPVCVGMGKKGFAYLPSDCSKGEASQDRPWPCRVHIVVHGCAQNEKTLGRSYVEHTGYNRWGDSNNIIMLYPQSSDKLNQFACWDFGQANYDDKKFHTREGKQVKTIMNMVKQLAGQSFEKVDDEKWHINLGFYELCI